MSTSVLAFVSMNLIVSNYLLMNMFDCGYRGGEVICHVCWVVRSSAKTFDFNGGPLSVYRCLGGPYYEKVC